MEDRMKYRWAVYRQVSCRVVGEGTDLRRHFEKCPLKMDGFMQQPVSNEDRPICTDFTNHYSQEGHDFSHAVNF